MDKDAKVYNWLKFVRYSLYPPRCVLCGRQGDAGMDLCRGCRDELPYNIRACRRCGAPLETSGAVCGPCNRHPPPFSLSCIPFRYEAPLDYLLQQLKFHQKLYLAPLLGGLMAEAIQGRSAPLPQCLLPVPLHTERLRERGYNQALELARPLSRLLDIPIEHRLCQRQRATSAQTSLQGTERRRNLRGAFVAVKGEMPRHVAIIDDVVTTGTTVEELARTLRRAGVETIEVWACARAGKW
jgi:ComF family protein